MKMLCKRVSLAVYCSCCSVYFDMPTLQACVIGKVEMITNLYPVIEFPQGMNKLDLF